MDDYKRNMAMQLITSRARSRTIVRVIVAIAIAVTIIASHADAMAGLTIHLLAQAAH